MQKILKKGLIGVFAVLISTVLLAVGIDAADNFGNYRESVVGRLIFGEAPGPCPADMVYISTEEKGFCIDKYEASAGEGCIYRDPGSQSETQFNLADKNCKSTSLEGIVPWRNISQTQAMQACAKAGKRLPSPQEWYWAALGTPDKPDEWGEEDCQVSNNWPAQPGITGSAQKCVSASGAYDMIGNVWEWVKGEIRDGKYEDTILPSQGYIRAVDINGNALETDLDNPDTNHNGDYLWIKEKGVRGMARGGYWNNGGQAGQFSIYLVSEPSFAGVGVGFRCVK